MFRVMVCMFVSVVGMATFFSNEAIAYDDEVFNLPGDRPVPATGAPVTVDKPVQFVKGELPAIYGPQKEWRTFRSTSRITCAVRQGNVLWAGTQGSGLILWDLRTGNYRFSVPHINHVDAKTIVALAVHKKDLWIATKGYGVAKLRYGHSKWKFFQKKDGLPGNEVNAILVSSIGDVWVGTTQGAARYRKGKWRKFTSKNGLLANDIQAIGEDSRGQIWFSTNITRPFSWNGGRFSSIGAFPVIGASCIVSDRKGGLWFCSDQGAVHYNGNFAKLYSVEHGLVGLAVRSIYIDVGGGVWLGTKGRGISYFKSGKWTTINQANGLPGLDIRSIVGASQGRLFVATFLNGVGRYRKRRWSRLPIGIVGNRIQKIRVAPDDAVWVGTASGASRFYQKYWYNYTSTLPNSDVRAFVFEPSGAVWIGTNGGGLVRYDGTSWKTVEVINGLASNRVIAGGLTPEGLWFLHPQKGLSMRNGNKWFYFTSASQGPVLSTVYEFQSFHVDPQFRLWIGSKGGGPVMHAYGGRWQKFTKMTGASTRGYVTAIVVDKKGRRWFGTQRGLYRVYRGRLKRFTKSDGLPTNHIQALALEGRKLWVGTSKGVACFDGNSWRTFTQDMGLVASNDITTIAVTPRGEKWFGSRYDGLTVYRGE